MKQKYIFAVVDPKGVLRNLYVEKPTADVIAWPYAHDVTNRSYIETPRDYRAAKRRGYRLVKLKISRAR